MDVKAILKEASNEIIDKILVKRDLPTNPELWKKEQSEALIAAFLECGETIFSDCAEPLDFMRHYIHGGGKEIEISLEALFREDRGANERVMNEIIRRDQGIQTIREKNTNSISTPLHGANTDPIITIFQRNFSTLRWWGCLGTYNISFQRIAARSTDRPRFMIEGTGIYMWHEDRAGLSEKIHKMGVKLLNWGVASNFEMKGRPLIAVMGNSPITNRKFNEAVTIKQTNPNHSSSVGSVYAMKVAKDYPLVAAKYLGKMLTGK